MEAIAPAPPAPSVDELIALLENPVKDVMRTEMSDENDPDRVWILRKNFNNYIYSRGLQNYASLLTQSILALTSQGGPGVDLGADEEPTGLYDYTQKHYTGFKRKFVAVIGNRLANMIAVPNNSNDEEGVRATRSANPAALYLRQKCDLESKFLDQAARIFDYGTTFWHLDWVEDGDKYGYRDEPQHQIQQQPLGNARFDCPNCGASVPSDGNPQTAPPVCPQCGTQLGPQHFVPPTMVPTPVQTGTKKVPKGALEIDLKDANEISVPLDSTCVDDCDWLRWDREEPKGKLLRKYGRDKLSDFDGNDQGHDTVSSQLGEFIRSAMASPIGLVRPNRPNRWTCSDIWWTPNQYELVPDKTARETLKSQFSDGARFCFVKGKLVDLKAEKLQDRWQETKPEPAPRIMTDALGDEWTETTDIANNVMNQCEQNVARSNLPLFMNSSKVDSDAWANRNTLPGDAFFILPRAGRALSDEIHQPQSLMFSEQAPQFRAGVIEDAKSNTGLVDAIWGGGEPDPTARQTLLKTNQALMQLGTHWTQIRKSLEKLMLKACKLLSQYSEGVIEFSKKNQFGRFDTLSFTTEDLRSDSYHFEADEAIPVNWGQQRDQLMWLLGQIGENPQLATMMGLTDPFNVFEFKQLIGIPGMHTPQFDAREKCMDVIATLISDVSAGPNGERPKQQMQPGPPGPDGQPGPPQPTVQPDWEDDHAFFSMAVKAYLLDNSDLKTSSPDAYANIQAYGQAQDAMANPPQPPAEPKKTFSVSLKGSDVGVQAVQDMLTKEGMLDPNTPVESDADKKLAQTDQMNQQQLAAQTAMPAPNGAAIQ